ncbi:MAG: outer membrane beta-barrel protein [Lentisphaerae bacterium]|nr:outer membrane beta-barrel protein [Lentisphaerota bacterium]
MKNITRLIVSAFCSIFVMGSVGAFAVEGTLVKFSVDAGMNITDNRDSDLTQKSNVDIYLRPKVDVDMDLQSALIGFYYKPTYRHRTNPRDGIQNANELHHDLNASLDMNIQRMKLKFEDRFALTDDPAIQNENGLRREDASYVMNRMAAGATYAFTRRSNIEASLKNMIKRYTDSSRELSNEDRTGTDVMFWRQMARSWGMLARMDISKFNYGSTNEVDRGFLDIGAGVGGEIVMSKTLRASIRHGWKFLDYDDSDFSSSLSPYFDISMQFAPIPKTLLNGGLAYELRESDVYPYASQQFTDLYAKFVVELGGNWTIGAFGRYRQGSYDADTAPATSSDPSYVTPVDGLERGRMVGAEATFKLNNMSSFKFVQSYENVNSEVRESFVRNSADLMFAMQF